MNERITDSWYINK